MGGGGNFFIALFHVLGHCSYEYDFFIFFYFFLFFPEKVQESRGVNTVIKKSFELGLIINNTKGNQMVRISCMYLLLFPTQ